MKQTLFYLVIFILFPIILRAQYTGGTGNGDTHLEFLNAHINVKMISMEIPEKFKLYQNYPNPFNPSTNIEYQITNSGIVTLKVYDILGKEIATLVNEKQAPGIYEIRWNGMEYASGIYFYELKSGDFTDIKKMILVK